MGRIEQSRRGLRHRLVVLGDPGGELAAVARAVVHRDAAIRVAVQVQAGDAVDAREDRIYVGDVARRDGGAVTDSSSRIDEVNARIDEVLATHNDRPEGHPEAFRLDLLMHPTRGRAISVAEWHRHIGEFIEAELDAIGKVEKFIYGTGSNYAEGILGHDDILKLTPACVAVHPLLRRRTDPGSPDRAQSTTCLGVARLLRVAPACRRSPVDRVSRGV